MLLSNMNEANVSCGERYVVNCPDHGKTIGEVSGNVREFRNVDTNKTYTHNRECQGPLAFGIHVGENTCHKIG